MTTKILDDIEPRAVMTKEEQARWAALPPEEQLARLRKAIDEGFASGISSLTMDDIWNEVSAEFPDAGL
jgi:hypothetical protein